jgi:hypothetical protein
MDTPLWMKEEFVLGGSTPFPSVDRAAAAGADNDAGVHAVMGTTTIQASGWAGVGASSRTQ